MLPELLPQRKRAKNHMCAAASTRTEDYSCEALLSSGHPRFELSWKALSCQGYLPERQRYTQLPEYSTNISRVISSTIPIFFSLLHNSGISKTAGLPTRTSRTSGRVSTVLDAATSSPCTFPGYLMAGEYVGITETWRDIVRT